MTKAPTITKRTKSDGVIYKTKKYEIFKKQVGNRIVKPCDFEAILLKIQSRNLLKYFPVLVNKDFEIIDGQHRVEVAKAEKLTVFYMMVPDADLVTTRDINVTGKKWSKQDFLNSYIELGNEHYIELAKFIKDTGNIYTISTAIYLFTGANGGHATTGFNEGTFEITRLGRKQANEIHDIITMFEQVGERLTSFTHFIRCVRSMHLKNVNVKWERLVEKCCSNINVIKSLPNCSKKVKGILEEIYSQGLRQRADFNRGFSV